MSEATVGGCGENMAKALWALTTGHSALPNRLANAALSFVVLRAQDFPPDLRPEFTRIREALTAAGSYETTVAQMEIEEARDLAGAIYELAAEVARRHAIEEQED